MYNTAVTRTTSAALISSCRGTVVKLAGQQKKNVSKVSRRWHASRLHGTVEQQQLPSMAVPKAFVIGGTAGALGSLAGMGGGFVMIPLMTSGLLKLSQHQAHGTSLFAVAATGIAGALGYADEVQWESAAAIAISGMMTAQLGARATSVLSERVLKRALGILMVTMAPAVPLKAYIMEQVEASRTKGLDKRKMTLNIDSPLIRRRTTAVMSSSLEEKTQSVMEKFGRPGLIGLGSGFLAGLFGVGGGTIVVPLLTVATDCTHYQALATSLAAMSLPAMAGTWAHHSAGNVALRVAPALALGAFCGGYIGGKFGSQTEELKLRLGFGGLVGLLGIRTLLKA